MTSVATDRRPESVDVGFAGVDAAFADSDVAFAPQVRGCNSTSSTSVVAFQSAFLPVGVRAVGLFSAQSRNRAVPL